MVGLPRVEGLSSVRALPLGDARRRWRAVVAASGAFGLFALVLLSNLPAIFPGYLAVIVAFAIWGLAPGLLLQTALRLPRINWLERLAFAFLFSLGLAAVPGLIALTLHWPIEAFAMLYGAVAAGAAGAGVVVKPSAPEPAADSGAARHALRSPLAIVAGVLLLAVVALPFWAGRNVARDADDLIYLAYVQNYTSNDSLNVSHVALGAHEGAFGRMEANVWLPFEALLAKNADVQPSDLILLYFPAIMAAFVMISAYTLAKGLFESEAVALLSAIFVMAYAALDLSPHEGYGRNVLLRIGEDKMVATFILLPVSTLLLAKFVSRRSLRGFIAAEIGLAALVVVHPSAAIFAGVGLLGFVAVRSLVERSVTALHNGAQLAAMWALPALAFVALSQLSSGAAPEGTALRFRRAFHVIDLPGGLIAGNYHMLLHPLMITAIIAAPLLLLSARRSLGAQVLCGSVAGAVLFFFVPLLGTPMAKAVTEQGLWRLLWLVPVPVILAYGCVEVAGRMRGRIGDVRVMPGVLPLILAGLICAGALVGQEQYIVADNGAFYNYTSATSLVPWADRSIALGGYDRASSGEWQLSGARAKLVDYVRTLPAGSRVLASDEVRNFLASTVDRVHIVNGLDSGTAEEQQLIGGLYGGSLSGDELMIALRALGIDYVVAMQNSLGADALNTLEPIRADQLQARAGSPTLDRHSAGAWTYPAWSFAPGQSDAQIGNARFTVPQDLNQDDKTLTVRIVVAPAADISRDETVSFVFAYFKANPGETPGPVTSLVFDVPLKAGMQAGGLVLAYHSAETTFARGDTYGFAIARLGDASTDTYHGDMLFAGVDLEYISTAATVVPGTPYEVVQVQP